MDDYKDAETAPPLPACCVDELCDVLMGAGPRMAGGMGAAPLNAQELLAWCTGTGNPLTPWEFATVLDMSRAYHAEFEDAGDPSRPAPWTDPDEVARNAERAMVARKTRGMFADVKRTQDAQAGR